MLQPPFPWENKKNILVTAHAFVDPDALGSILTMGSFLRKAGKNVTLLALGGIPKNLRFLLAGQEVISELKEDLASFDLIVILDCGDLSLLQIPGLLDSKNKILNIDHHPDNSLYGKDNWVDSSKPSVTKMVYEFLKSNDYEVDAAQATNILAGLMGDTGSFTHANTNSESLKVAGELLLLGAKLNQVVRYLFAGKTPGQLKAWSYVVEKATLDKNNGAIVSALTSDDIDQLGVEDEAFEGIVEILNTFPDAKFAAFIRQRGDEIKFSLRSEEYKGVNVSELAAKFGGGGHKLSSGFRIPGKLRRDNGNVYVERIGGLGNRPQVACGQGSHSSRSRTLLNMYCSAKCFAGKARQKHLPRIYKPPSAG